MVDITYFSIASTVGDRCLTNLGWAYVHKDPLSHPLDPFPINLKYIGQ